MKVDEDQINRWANPPSDTENEKSENSIRTVTDALRERFGTDISIVRQGSHRNKTNIKLDSDVDFAVVHTGYFFHDISDLSDSDKQVYERGRTSAGYSFSQFKTDVYSVLTKKFGVGLVQKKNKCIRVLGNTYRLNADVVPAFEHKRFSTPYTTSAEGIGIWTDKGDYIQSYPEQHYKNGVKKNDDTSRAFKSVVRVLKNIRNDLVDKNLLKLEVMPSFFVESLVWNVAKDFFSGTTWREDVENVTAKIWNDMRDATIANEYAEVSDLMWLFRGKTNRTPKQAEDFMLEAWRYVNKKT
ncbi:MAG: nucleotidyltransferase [bacterium]|nr:nucleotidyltransferase [bacterium]